jgi:REP element-mobilizing transposase RayT
MISIYTIEDMPNNDFNTGEPLAYFLTWTTYGTWLPGDDRGWNRKRDHDSLEPSIARQESAIGQMKETPYLLAKPEREIVEDTIRKHCEIRNWAIHAVNVRSNHVHVVATAPATKPETVVSQFKTWCTRKLKAKCAGRSRFWTEGASTRWINTEAELAKAIEYTLEAQDRKGI